MRIAAPLLILLAALDAQAAWLELRHGPFVVYTDAGAEPARLALNHLEQFRYAVGEAAGKPEPALPWPVTVVVRKPGKGDTLDAILADPQRDALLDWLRHRPLATQACGWLLVHAGVIPQWTAQQTLALAGEIETLLRSPDIATFLPVMYGNEPRRWDPALEGPDRWRFVVNTLTRMRLCSADGELELKKDAPGEVPPGMLPWFEHPTRLTRDTPMAFGHWSQLGLIDSPMLLSTDTGCVWGGSLTAVRVDGGHREVIQVKCPQARRPG